VKNPLAATVLLTFALGVRATYLPALTNGQTKVARVPMKQIAGEEVVQVSINGTGPYNFILDTGSNVTIIRSELIRKLNLSGGSPVPIVTATAETSGQRMIIESMAVAGLAVEHLEINALDRVPVLNGHVQGILGENFLKNFDILIDNEQQTLFIDRTSSLEGTVAGERLSFSRSGSFDHKPTPDRIVVELKVPSFIGKPLLFLVDSGINTATLYPPPGGQALRALQSSQDVSVSDLTGRRDCQIQKAAFEIGGDTFRGLELVACEDLTRNKMDTDGLLPTRVFHRFFISHRGGYVIVNPRSSAALQVLVFDYTGLSAPSLREFTRQTQVILSNEGLSAEVEDCTRATDGPCFSQDRVQRRIEIRVVNQAQENHTLVGSKCLGVSFINHDGGTSASVYRELADQEAADFGLPREVVLAYAAAHEAGHLLLGEAHTPNGLMKAHWGTEEFQAISQRRLTFSSDQRRELTRRYGRSLTGLIR